MVSYVATGLGVLPREVWEMDMREVNDLMATWIDSPPPHVVLSQIRDVVITGLGGKVPQKKTAPTAGVRVGGKVQTPEQLAKMFGIDLGAG